MKISVCMATFNGERFISQQVSTIIKQLRQDDELIISDDSSTDNTVEIIKGFHDNRIILLENQKFNNPILNVENSIKNSKGNIIFLSDQDDVWFNGKVQEMIEWLGFYDLVVSDCKVTDENLNILSPSFFKSRKSGKGVIKNLFKNSYLGCCMAFKRTLLKYILPFPKNIPMHDWWIGLVAELTGKVIFLEEPLIFYRRHNKSVSATARQSNEILFKKLKWRYIMLKELLIRHSEIKNAINVKI